MSPDNLEWIVHMKPDRRSYNAAYKAEAVRLAVERNNVTSVARDLGIG